MEFQTRTTRKSGRSLNFILCELIKLKEMLKNGIYNILQHKTTFKMSYKTSYKASVCSYKSAGLKPASSIYYYYKGGIN
jgi:hypothetical protein